MHRPEVKRTSALRVGINAALPMTPMLELPERVPSQMPRPYWLTIYMLISFFWKLEGIFVMFDVCFCSERYKTVLNATYLRSTFFLGRDWTPRLVLSMAKITLSSIPYVRLYNDYLGWQPLGIVPVKGQMFAGRQWCFYCCAFVWSDIYDSLWPPWTIAHQALSMGWSW